MLMKAKFVELCESADAIIMGGIVMKYYFSSNTLGYRVFGEELFVNLDEISDENFKFDGEYYTITRFNCVYKFKFYQEIN